MGYGQMFIIVLNSQSSTSGGFGQEDNLRGTPEGMCPAFEGMLNSISCMIAFSAHVVEKYGIL
jgi:hypothetical protein